MTKASHDDDGSGADPRAVLDRLIRARGEDYAALSRMLLRNPAYIQQFIKRGSPRRLSEGDRAMLAAYFQIDERLLGAPEPQPGGAAAARRGAVGGLVAVPRLDVGASAGGGAIDADDRADSAVAFDPRWLRRVASAPQHVRLIRVDGDSMAPTLGHGDEIMVDGGDGVDRLRDGIYVLRRDGLLLVKRLACGAARGPSGARTVAIVSDNPAYPVDADVPVAALAIIGRVVWTGRLVG